MKGTCAVSVIVPVYNAEKYLEQCIDSILAQTLSDFELLLVDDGSTDGSPEICEAFAKKDCRVQVVHQKNAGASAARNRGLDLAQGEWIMFSDCDDYMDPVLLEQAYRAVKETGTDLYISGLVQETFVEKEIISRELFTITNPKTVCSPRELLEDMGIAYPLIYLGSPVGKLYRRACIESQKARFHREISLMEDLLFNLDAMPGMNLIYISDENYYHYRKENQESLSSGICPRYYEMCAYVCGHMREVMQELGCSGRSTRHFEKMCFSALCGGIVNFYTHSTQTTVEMRREMIEKVAANPIVRQLGVRDALTGKQKALLLFMKLHLTALLAKLLEVYYHTNQKSK